MMIFKKAIPRRTFLRGMGATLALPLLEGMIPAFAGSTSTAVKAPVRLGIVFVGNGMWPMDKWTPKAEGATLELTPTLEPLTPFRDQLLVLSGLAQNEGRPLAGESGEHGRADAAFLTGVHAKGTSSKDFRAGISVDQIVAGEVGRHTQLASLEVSLFSGDLVGDCETGLSCVFLNTLSWRTPTTPLPMENNPRSVFERLFGDSDTTDQTEALARMRQKRSILDGVAQRASRFAKELGSADRAKLTEYLEAVRDIERRIQIAEEQPTREVPKFDKPLGTPASFEEYAKLMIDLQVLAYQTDLTRVITFMMGRDGPFGGRAYPEIGIGDLHHNLSHHQNDAGKIEKLFQINVYHCQLFAYYLEKLRSTPDGDGNLLDHSIILYGSSLSDGNLHLHDNLPILLAGGGGGDLKGGRHIRYPQGTPMTNLLLTVLDNIGLPLDKFGDSTGKLDLLSV